MTQRRRRSPFADLLNGPPTVEERFTQQMVLPFRDDSANFGHTTRVMVAPQVACTVRRITIPSTSAWAYRLLRVFGNACDLPADIVCEAAIGVGFDHELAPGEAVEVMVVRAYTPPPGARFRDRRGRFIRRVDARPPPLCGVLVCEVHR